MSSMALCGAGVACAIASGDGGRRVGGAAGADLAADVAVDVELAAQADRAEELAAVLGQGGEQLRVDRQAAGGQRDVRVDRLVLAVPDAARDDHRRVARLIHDRPRRRDRAGVVEVVTEDRARM